MKAAIAILSDHHVQNVARRMVYEMSQYAPLEFLGSLLPAHVSLKQPFTFEDMDALETWFESLSERIQPFPVELDHIYYDHWDEYGIVGLHVVETPILRNLHDQINDELKDLVLDPSAPHDGKEYEFHLTVELGKVGEMDPFKRFYDSLTEKQVKLSFTASHIALFYYQDGPIGVGTFNCYKVLPLGAV